MKEKPIKTAPKCCQCNREMTNGYGNGDWQAQFCAYPECPNFALLQATGLEKLK